MIAMRRIPTGDWRGLSKSIFTGSHVRSLVSEASGPPSSPPANPAAWAARRRFFLFIMKHFSTG